MLLFHRPSPPTGPDADVLSSPSNQAQDIVEILIEREARNAERRINWMRGTILAVALFVLMPIRAFMYGLHGGNGDLAYTLAWLSIGFVGTLLLGWLMRSPRWGRYTGSLGILFDFAILAGLIAGQSLSGYVPAVSQSIETYQLLLPIGLTMNALSGLRLSRAQVLLSGVCSLGLVAETVWIDTVVHGAPFYAVTTGLLVTLVGVITLGTSVMVMKTRTLIAESSRMTQEVDRVKGVLSRYVSKPVAENILQNEAPLGNGRRQRVTVMFSDIRGFTGKSEDLPPEAVVAFLNDYFSRMVGAVFEYEGMLDKYIGDGMMAVFGAPILHEDHALRAVQAALRMRQELELLNQELVAKGESPLAIGIGLHTGESVIGNIGTEQRLDYTAIGDTVNTASRIESLTGKYGVDILMSAQTYQDVMNHVEVRHMPRVPIRGKTAQLDLFVLEGLKHAVPQVAPKGAPTKLLW